MSCVFTCRCNCVRNRRCSIISSTMINCCYGSRILNRAVVLVNVVNDNSVFIDSVGKGVGKCVSSFYNNASWICTRPCTITITSSCVYVSTVYRNRHGRCRVLFNPLTILEFAESKHLMCCKVCSIRTIVNSKVYRCLIFVRNTVALFVAVVVVIRISYFVDGVVNLYYILS